MKKFNVKQTKGVWITSPDDKEVQVLIKPVSIFSLTKLPSEEKITVIDAWNMFKEMVLDWKGIVDEDAKVIKCDDDGKKLIYEYDQDLVSFIIEECNELREKVSGSKKEIKNSETSQPGEEAKQEK